MYDAPKRETKSFRMYESWLAKCKRNKKYRLFRILHVTEMQFKKI